MANDWLRYANQGATRNQPLDPRLVNALSFLPTLGVQAEVFSGGQDAEGPNRTGSHRHDHGGAGDMRFYKDGRMLDWANPADRPIFEDIVRDGKANGITGIGAGPGYMSEGSMHMGFGKPSVWGAGGHTENAPDWLKAAYNGVAAPAAAPSLKTPGFDPVAEVVQAAGPQPSGAAPMMAQAQGFAPSSGSTVSEPSPTPKPFFGSLFGGPPAPAQAPPADAIPPAVQSLADGSAKSPMANLFGALSMMGQDQGPKFSPVQIQGPSQEQSQGLSQLIQALKQRLA